MRPRLVAVLAALLIALTACGRTVTTVASPAPITTPPSAAPSAEPTDTATAGSPPTDAMPTESATGDAPDPGDATCGALTKEDIVSYGLMAQLFPQLGNAGALKTIQDGIVEYDPKTFAETLAKLEFLRGQTAPIGDPGESLDYYYAVNDALAVLLAVPEPTQSDFDAYLSVVGDIGSSIMKQAAITSLLGELCPDVL